MTPERWAQVKEIFQTTLDLAPAERAAYVASACAGDEALRREVESLLAYEAESTDFLTRPADQYVPGILADEAPDANIGRRIGPYLIEREIGAGGMGAVYLAERVDEFRQKVALKLMLRGMDSRMVVSRFRHERQILASLDHPNIARLLDGGATDDGRPYFVMEYVQGEPIDRYCQERALSIPYRLKLFRQVCAAVQYAHQNLVVHRDLKPGNILVTTEGVPKLLDFGIAKLLRSDAVEATALTDVGMRVMTPEYASPEQVMGLAVTTASDVYSLGVVLYELLAGRMPYAFETRTALDVERTVCRQEPPLPSLVSGAALAKHLAGDLDNIVLKSLEKEPARRYRSVEQFSEDIRRHLEGRPVTARPQTAMYRAGKFVRRNRLAVSAAAVLLLSLTGGLIGTAWQAHVAGQQRARAERRFNEVRRLSESFLFDFHDKIKDLVGATEARRMLVDKALELFGSLERDAAGDRGLLVELAEAYVRLGDVQGNPYESSIGDSAGALARYDQGLKIARQLLRDDPRDEAAQRIAASALDKRGEVLPLMGREREAVDSLRQSVAGFQKLVAAFPAKAEYRADLSSSLEILGDVLGQPSMSDLEDTAGARDAYTKALDLWKTDPDRAHAARVTADLTTKLGDLELDTNRSRAFYLQALDALRGADMSNPENVRLEGKIRRKLAYILSDTDPAAALKLYQASVERLQQLVAADPKNSRARMDLAVMTHEAGQIAEDVKPWQARAIDFYRISLNQLTAMQAIEPGNIRLTLQIAETDIMIGARLAVAGKTAEAEDSTRRGLDLERAIAERPGATPGQHSDYAEALERAGPPALRDPAAAFRHAKMASDGVDGRNPEYWHLMAEAQFQAGHASEAVALERKGLALLPEGSPIREQFQRHIERYRK